MADTDREDKTLPPSPRRLEKAREEGQVPRSRELAGALIVAAAVGAFAAGGSTLVAAGGSLVRHGLTFDANLARNPERAFLRFSDLAGEAFAAWGPLALLLFVAAAAAPLALGGWNFTWKPVMPQWTRIDPLAGLGRLVSLDAWIELGKSVLKALVIFAVAGWVLWDFAGAFAALGAADPASGLALAAHVLTRAGIALVLAIALIAAVDVPLAIFTHLRGLRMTRQEMVDEQRESEGDPQLKARIRSTQRAIARRRMMAAVPKATVVVTNPTHYAVAIEWREGMAAPRVVAKGTGAIAARIREIAAQAGVPLLEAPALARALHRHVKLDQAVPPALYNAVAQVLAWVFQLKRATARGERWPVPPDRVEVPAGLDPLESGARA